MKTTFQKFSLYHRGQKSSSFVLKALPSALALVFAQPGWTTDPSINVGGAAGLPLNGTVASGTATGSVAGNQLTIDQATGRAVIDWTSFSIAAGKSVLFNQPNASSAVLNRVGAGADASQIMGSLQANGTVMLMNPNGVMFGVGSAVNVGSLIATTGTIQESNFLTIGGAIISGATGNITSQGNITATAGASGLVALVAPSVINQGSITATGGKIALAGSTAATISLNGGLYEFAIPAGATGVQVSNTASASLNAANIHLGVGDAANLLSGVINLEGVQQATNAIVVNGHTVELKSALQAPSVSGSSSIVNVSGAARIQNGVDIARVGGAVNIAAGTYVQPITLKIEKSLTLSGAGEGSTLIDARGVAGYGIEVTADDVTLKDFTLYGPTANIESAYGIKVAPSGNGASARLHDFSIRNVTIRGSGKAELDLNGVNGAVIDHVTADGAPVGGGTDTRGAGIQITDSANVTVSNSTTRNNLWGGLALYQANIYRNQQVNNITVEASNSFTERNPVYMQDESASRDFGALNIAGFDYAVRNSSSTNSNHQYTWLQASRQNAFDHAVNLGSSSLSYVQGWNGALTTQNFHVGTGSLLGGGTQAMSIGTAVNAVNPGGAVDVYAGSYAEQLTLNKAGLTLQGHEGAKLVVPDATEVNGISIAANNVTVTGMEIAGPIDRPYYQYYASPAPSNISRGIAVADGVTGFTIRNNNIHDVRNGILIHGRNSTGSVTDNRIENTKSGISVQYTDGAGITMAGNTQGTVGNEWGINLHLNGHLNGSNNIVDNTNPISAAPTLAWQQSLLGLSAANAGWSVQDQAYTSSNRTHVNVAIGGSSSAQGSALTPINSIQGGIEAVVTGGTVNVGTGTFAENVNITKALTLEGAGAGQSVIAPTAGDGVTVSGNIGATSEILIDGFTFRNAPGSGVRVANNTVLNKLTVQNSDFLHNGKFGFFADGLATAGIPGLQNVSLLNSTFTGNGAPYTSATSLGQGDINFNYYNGNARLKDLRITGENEFVGIQFRGYHNNVSSGGVHDAGTLVFDNVTIDGNFRRPIGSAGTWNPQGPGDAFHLLEYGSVANVSFHNVAINPTVGHGMFLEGLGSTLDIGNTRFGVPDSSIAGTGTNPTRSWNIYAGSNDRNNAKTNVNATRASFTGAANGFAIEDRVHHALDVAGLGVVSWEAGNLYVTQASGSIQRGIDAASVGNTVNVDAGIYAEDMAVNKRYNFLFNDTRLHSLTLHGDAAGSGIGGAVTADGAGGFKFNAPVNLLADTTLTTLGADISFNGDIQNASGVARALRLIAGSGGTRGNVHLTTGGSAASPLGRFDVSANQFSLASTLWVRSYKIDALGDVTLSNSTLRAQDTGAASTLNAGGDVTGSTISQGSVEVISAGDIEAHITGTDVVAQAQGAMDVVVTASQTATLTADTIVANITAADVVAQSRGDMNVVVTASNSASLAGDSVVANVTAPVVAVEAVNDAQISGAASQITLDAPRGSVSGSFGQISNTGGGLINVNGKPQGNQTLSSNSENNRVVPTGGVLDNGAEGAGLQLAQAGGAALQGGSDIVLSTPEAAGDAVDSGRAVELDMSPRKRGQDKNTEKDKEKDREKDKEKE